jgi:hypothetical protein
MDKTPLSNSFPLKYRVGLKRNTLIFLRNNAIKLHDKDDYRNLLLLNQKNEPIVITFGKNLDHLLLFLSYCIKLKGETYHNLFNNKSKQLVKKLQYFGGRIGSQRLHKVQSQLSNSTNKDIDYQEQLSKTNFSIVDIVNICNAIPFILTLYIEPNQDLRKENEQLYIKAQEYFTKPLILTDLTIKIFDYFVEYMKLSKQYSYYYSIEKMQNKLQVSKSYFNTVTSQHNNDSLQRIDFNFLCKMILCLDCDIKFTLSTPQYTYNNILLKNICFN